VIVRTMAQTKVNTDQSSQILERVQALVMSGLDQLWDAEIDSLAVGMGETDVEDEPRETEIELIMARLAEAVGKSNPDTPKPVPDLVATPKPKEKVVKPKEKVATATPKPKEKVATATPKPKEKVATATPKPKEKVVKEKVEKEKEKVVKEKVVKGKEKVVKEKGKGKENPTNHLPWLTEHYMARSIADLKVMARELEVRATGKKEDLVKAIMAAPLSQFKMNRMEELEEMDSEAGVEFTNFTERINAIAEEWLEMDQKDDEATQLFDEDAYMGYSQARLSHRPAL